MNKRFFVHLDLEHLRISNEIKADLLKFYLIHAIKVKEREKITEFFSMYSHELLNESGIARNMKTWYILPYLDDPLDDPDFAPYFQQKWTDGLRLTLANFLTIVLSTAPPPKLLLLERWYRAEAQQELRLQLKQSYQKVDLLVSRLEQSEERLASLREVVKDMANYVAKASVASLSKGNVGLFETDIEAEEKRQKVRELGQSACRLASECSAKSLKVQSLPSDAKLREILGSEASSLYFGTTNHVDKPKTSAPEEAVTIEELENDLLEQLKLWMRSLSI